LQWLKLFSLDLVDLLQMAGMNKKPIFVEMPAKSVVSFSRQGWHLFKKIV
jgi:copper(I)-binding protein